MDSWVLPRSRIRLALHSPRVADGSNVIDVSSTAVIDTTFMKVAGFNNMTVRSSGQAARRLVDMSFVIDKSGSIGSDWPQVQSAATDFVESFDDTQDRIALIMYSSNTVVFDPINTSRGFNKSSLTGTHCRRHFCWISLQSSEGLYRGWDELRRVPSGSQSGLRVIVLFTDGVSQFLVRQFLGFFRICRARALLTRLIFPN